MDGLEAGLYQLDPYERIRENIPRPPVLRQHDCFTRNRASSSGI